MSIISEARFIERQIVHIRQGGPVVLIRKAYTLLLLMLAVPLVVMARLIQPWLLIRWGTLRSSSMGHFAANTELYLCEQDARINMPRQRHVDILNFEPLICNQQLAKMWKRALHIWPHLIGYSIFRANRLIPGGAAHEVPRPTSTDRDVHNLLDQFPPHLNFTAEEEARGAAGLQMMGIPSDAPFVCLNARDKAYLDAHSPRDWSYHDYRNTDVQNYVLAAEELGDRGYFVIRMGAKVLEAMKSSHPRVIDYATNGMLSDFMDVYLGAKCEFGISDGNGFQSVPLIFHRPIAWVNIVPFGYLWTFRAQFIGITKHHYSLEKKRELTLREIFTQGAGHFLHTSEYESKGIKLIENTPEEVRDLAIEMAERLKSTWRLQEDDEALQQMFWEIFPTDAKSAQGNPLHGEIRGRSGAAFLRNNREWLK